MTQPTDDIKLPEMGRVQVPRVDADIDLMDIKRLAEWCKRTADNHARAAVLADRERSGHKQCFGDLLEERSKVGILQSALEVIAKYPANRSDEIGYAGCRRIAREALDAAMAREAECD